MISLSIIISYCVLVTNCRLIEKHTERNDVTEPAESLSPVRVSRQAFYDDGIGVSREDTLQLHDYPRSYVRKGRYSIRSSQFSDEITTKSPRVYRDSKEKIIKSKKPAKQAVEQTKTPRALIKKPISKFNDIDYEEFQMKMDRSPVKFADSGEHEDEDFNLDDYEFDVGHDEFVGRGKPLEPRTKPKQNKPAAETKIPNAKPIPAPEIKTQRKVMIPAVDSANVKRNVITKKVADKIKEDYYDDESTTTRAPATDVKRDLEDDFADDSEEYTRKPPMRIVRSPLAIERIAKSKMGEKAASLIAKLMDIVPLFDSVSYERVNELRHLPLIDPISGREYIIF